MNKDEIDGMVNALRPAMVAELADDAYARRPDAAQVRARAATVDPRPARQRRPARRVAFLAGATAAVTAAAVVAAGVLSGGHGGGTAPNTTADTRVFLLASAETAAKQPATHGTCWYSRTRMWQDLSPAKYAPGEPSPIPIGKQPRVFPAETASSSEDWACTRSGGTGMRFRGHGPLDIKVTFPTPRDQAAWKAAGSPPLPVNGGTTASKPSTTTYDESSSHLVNPDIGTHEIAWKTIPTLPATRNGLESYLRKLWEQDRKRSAITASTDFGLYVFENAADLLTAPTTPGTRAALYRIIADCPSVHVVGRVTDREGRSGVAVTAETPDGVIGRLVIDPATAQLLDRESGPGDRPGTPGAHSGHEYQAIERQGWVNRIGAVPAS